MYKQNSLCYEITTYPEVDLGPLVNLSRQRFSIKITNILL